MAGRAGAVTGHARAPSLPHPEMRATALGGVGAGMARVTRAYLYPRSATVRGFRPLKRCTIAYRRFYTMKREHLPGFPRLIE